MCEDLCGLNETEIYEILERIKNGVFVLYNKPVVFLQSEYYISGRFL